jgi:hypothetical protein
MARTFVIDYNAQKLYEAEKNLEEFAIVRFDDENNFDRMHLLKTANNESELFVGLQEVVQHIDILRNAENCLQHIRSLIDENVMLIITRHEPLSDELMTTFINFPHVVCVYDYERDPPWRKHWRTTDPLMDQEMMIWSLSWISPIRSIEKLDQPSQIFIVKQLLIQILLNLESTPEGKIQFTDYCRKVFAKDESDLKQIHDFECNYTSGQAIHWYTKPCFVPRIIRRICASNDPTLMFKIHVIIAELHSEMRKLSEKQQKESKDIKILHTYRGKLITREELELIEKNNNNVFITNSFTSTSTDKQIASVFSGAGDPRIEDKVSVIYSMRIDTTKRLINPVAFIAEQSYMRDEKEVLLPIGFPFRLIAMKKDKVNND